LKHWSDENPKAGLMRRKRAAIVGAARQLFLEGGYAKTPMDAIADQAGVGIKTVYRHFENKEELFSAVMRAACGSQDVEDLDAEPGRDRPGPERAWFSQPPRTALFLAGVEYLEHVLASEQLGLYRVVAQDAQSFPELGRHYQEQVTEGRNVIFCAYLDRWETVAGWEVRDKRAAANCFCAMLKAGVFEEALFGGRRFLSAEIERQARKAADQMLFLLAANRL
jgi:TetR/AcrR family transcriptional repressor of mexJK operon